MTVGLTMLNRKGGAGKTPVTIHLAGALASLDKRVLVCDLDGQADLTKGVGFKRDVWDDEGNNILTMLMDIGVDPNRYIRRAPNDSFDVLPGNQRMQLAERHLRDEHNREGRLASLFQRIKTQYDFILVDCPPALNAVTDNALVACRRVLIPARMHQSFSGSIHSVIDQVRSIRKHYGITLDVVGIVPVAYERQQKRQRAFLEGLEETSPELVAPALTKRDPLIEDARVAGCSIFAFEPDDHYLKGVLPKSKAEFLELAVFVMKRVQQEAS